MTTRNRTSCEWLQHDTSLQRIGLKGGLVFATAYVTAKIIDRERAGTIALGATAASIVFSLVRRQTAQAACA